MILIKCADISNECRPMEVAEPWIDCLLQEFFNQVCDTITFSPYREFLWQFTAMWLHAEAVVLMKWVDFRWVVATLITLKIMSLCSVAVMESGRCFCYVSRVEPPVTKYNLDFHCFKRVLFPVLFSRVAKKPVLLINAGENSALFCLVYTPSYLLRLVSWCWRAAHWIRVNIDSLFPLQSDLEKKEGLPVSPLMDRDKVNKNCSQVNFIKFVLLPLFDSLAELFPQTHVS